MTGLLSWAVKLVAILRHRDYWRALRLGVAASTEHANTPLPFDYATVLDVGANRGQFALLAAHRFPAAQIICFEPLDVPRATLERVFFDDSRVRVVGIALAASARRSQMFVSAADDSSSLLAPTALQLATFPRTNVVQQVSLTTERLDVLLDGEPPVRPALLKIDVQGAELDVLIGAEGILGQIDTILVECSFVELYTGQSMADDIVRFLHDHDFRLTGAVTPHVDAHRRIVQADLVFARHPGESASLAA